MRARAKVLLVAELARAKKAEDLVILDIRKVSNITDFFVIATASSTKRAQTITDNIEYGLLRGNTSISSIEGYQEGGWILIDAYDVVAHIFKKEVRRFYNLEKLWSDAPRVKLCQKKKRSPSKKTLKGKSKNSLRYMK